MNEEQERIIEESVRNILIAIGEDVEREGLIETPKRIAKMYKEIFSSVREERFTNYKIFNSPNNNNSMVLIKDIPFYSMCEHHLLPFFGKVHIAYIARDGKIIGLSKIPRLVDFVAKRPNVQENLTANIASTLQEILNPLGIAIIVEARHMCVEMRGVKKINSTTKTSYYTGDFESESLRREFHELIKC